MSSAANTPTLTLPRKRGRELAATAPSSPSPAGGGGSGWGLAMSDTLRVGPLDLEVLRRGSGAADPAGARGQPGQPEGAVSRSAGRAWRGHRAVASRASANSPLPEDFDTMYDLVHLYRDVLDALPDGS